MYELTLERERDWLLFIFKLLLYAKATHSKLTQFVTHPHDALHAPACFRRKFEKCDTFTVIFKKMGRNKHAYCTGMLEKNLKNVTQAH